MPTFVALSRGPRVPRSILLAAAVLVVAVDARADDSISLHATASAPCAGGGSAGYNDGTTGPSLSIVPTGDCRPLSTGSVGGAADGSSTAVAASVYGSGNGGQYAQLPTVTATSLASADLATTQLRLAGANDSPATFLDQASQSGVVHTRDDLSLHVGGATSSTTTSFLLTYTMTGSAADPLAKPFDIEGGLHVYDLTAGGSLLVGPAFQVLANGTSFGITTNGESGFQSVSPTSLLFERTITFTGSDVMLEFLGDLYANTAEGTSYDYLTQYTLTLAAGTTVTSSSGVFASLAGTTPPVAAVPEPGEASLLVAGLVALGWLQRRRGARRAGAAAA